MPLSINVGLSRKASKDYQSTGVSIKSPRSWTSRCWPRPDELQEQIHGFYAQAEKALDRQGGSRGSQTNGQSPVRNGYGQRAGQPRNGNGHSGNGWISRGNGAMTDSHRRAISAIAERAGVDAAVEAREIIGAELDQMSLRQASELIDHLKGLSSAG